MVRRTLAGRARSEWSRSTSLPQTVRGRTAPSSSHSDRATAGDSGKPGVNVTDHRRSRLRVGGCLRRWAPAALLAVGAAGIAWVVAVLLTGGLHLHLWGWQVTSSDPWRAGALSALSFAAFLFVTRLPGERLVGRFERSAVRLAGGMAVIIAVVIVALAVRFGTYTAGGSDAYGYVSQAHRLLEGSLRTSEPLATSAPWPDATWTLSPLGYRPGPQNGTIVPTYAAGLPMLMAAALMVAGPCGPYYVGPVCAGALVFLTFLLGRRLLLSPAIALLGACLVAASPAFLSQVVLPMSDIPAAAFLAGGVLLAMSERRAAPLLAGLLTGCAVIIRPNLVVAGLPVAAIAACGGVASAVAPAAGSRRVDWTRLAWFVAGAVPGVVVVATVNVRLHGAPWASGYGQLGELYSLANVAPNLTRYAQWLVDTNTPAVLIGLAGLVVAPWTLDRLRSNGLLATAIVLAVVAVAGQYLLYATFEEWTYLRFLLPVWPVLMISTAGTTFWILSRVLSARIALALTLVAGVGVSAVTSATAGRLGVFRAREFERRYADVARFAADALPANAVFITLQHSGSLRFYARRPTLRFDLLDPLWLDRAIDHLRRAGHHPFILLEDWEVGPFRQRFSSANAAGRLDWCPSAVLRRPVTVVLYDAVARSCQTGTLEILEARSSGCGPPTPGP